MGNNGSNGGGHWSDSSNVLRDAEKMRTRPMGGQSKPTPDPFKVDQEQLHTSVTTGEGEMPLGKGFHLKGEGPNMHVGGKTTKDGGGRLDGQMNLGGVSLEHRNDNHVIGVGTSVGIGGGFQMHGGEMPGVSMSGGPFSGTFRSTSLNKPMSPETERMMSMLQDMDK